MELGARIRHFRKIRGLTQLELAERSGISRTYLADTERGRYNPSLDTLKAIANALQTGLHELIGEEKEKDGPPAADPTVKELIFYLDTLELAPEEIVDKIKFQVDDLKLSREEALEFVNYVRVKRMMKNASTPNTNGQP